MMYNDVWWCMKSERWWVKVYDWVSHLKQLHYQVWCWRGPRKVRPHLILLRKTQVLAWMELYEWELDSWDALVEEIIDSLQSPFLAQRDGSALLQDNCLTHTTMAISRQAFRILRLASSWWAPNAASTACKDLSHLTYFNNDKKDQANKEQKYLKRLMTVVATSALMRLTWTVPRRLPWNEFLTFNSHDGSNDK